MSIIQGTSKSSAAAAYTIDQSIRLNDNDSAYLHRTPASDGNRKTWTFSTWIKRGNIGTAQVLFGCFSTYQSYLRINADNKMQLYNERGSTSNWTTTQVFRDPGAWMHVVWQYDVTQATANDRQRLWINGGEVTDFTRTSTAAQNTDGTINIAAEHRLFRQGGSTNYYDGYAAEINFVDGTALDATSFGEYNADTGQWVPIAYTGSYGTNGFYITGADSADLGADDSGNGNDFTSSGLTAADQVTDSPTDNFPTLNSTFDYYTSGNASYFRPNFAVSLLSEGNLKIDFNSPNTPLVYSTATFPSSGKFYFEVTADIANGGGMGIGGSNTIEDGIGSSAVTGMANCIIYYSNGNLYNQSSTQSSYGNATAIANGEFVGVAVDIDNDAIWFCDNGTWVDGDGTDSSATVLAEIEAGTTTSAAATNFLADQNSWHPMVAAVGDYPTYTTNFGQSSFTGSAPAGFTNLSTANLPDPTIADPSAYFDTLIWSGDSSNKNITGLDFTPDFLWIKQRNQAFSVGHQLYDVVRGAGSEKELDSSSTAAEGAGNPDVYGYPSAFVSGGFTATAGTSGDWDYVNKSGVTYVAWNWLADNTTGSSNTDGSTTSTVSVNTTSGFSIATYTGTGANATVGHGLGVVPSFVLVKSRNDTHDWYVWTPDLATTEFLKLNTTAAKGTASPEVWNSTAPTSSVVSLGTSIGVNRNTYNYVMYCFAEVEGFSKFGSFTGNGSSTDGPFIYTGFKPEFFMWKRTDSGTYGDWTMLDTKRDPFNMAQENLRANSTMAGDTGEANLDFVSNGIKHRGGTSARFNQSGATYIYMAFAETPFKTATAR